MFVRREIEYLRRTVVPVAQVQYMALHGGGVLPLPEGDILDLMRPFLAANGVEQMPVALESDDRRVLHAETLVVGRIGRCQHGRAE